MYKLTKPINDSVKTILWQKDDVLKSIPVDESNTDYKQYLKWLDGYEFQNGSWVKTSDGNEPLPADE